MRRSEMYTLPDTCTPDKVGLLSDQEAVPVGGLGASDRSPVMDTTPFSPEIISVQEE